MKLPMSMSEVNAEWIGSVLAKHDPDARVESVQCLDVIHGSATKIRVGINYKKGLQGRLPTSVMVKIGFEPFSGQLQWLYDEEVNSYANVLPRFDLDLPKCLHYDVQDAPSQVVLVLEDLNLRGAKFGIATSPYSIAEVTSGVRLLAAIHAGTWNDTTLAATGLKPALTWGEQAIVDDFIERATDLLARPRGFSVPIALHDKATFKEKWAQYCDLVLTGPQCLLHGDAHVGNSFVVDGRVNFLDWQIASIGHWSHDVGYFMLSALDVPDRRRSEEAILRAYLTELTRLGVDAPSFAQAWNEYKRSMIFSFVLWMGNPIECQPEQVNLSCFARAGIAITDHGGFEAVLPKSSNLKHLQHTRSKPQVTFPSLAAGS